MKGQTLARQEVAVGLSFMAQTCPQIQVPSGQVIRTDSWATSLELGQVGALSCGSVSLPQPERKGWPSRTSERKERGQPGLGIPSWRLCLISKNLPDCPYFSSFHSGHHLTSFLSCRSFAGFFPEHLPICLVQKSVCTCRKEFQYLNIQSPSKCAAHLQSQY